MVQKHLRWQWLGQLAVALLLAVSLPAGATVARMQTSLGVIDIRLYDSAAPVTVANFLKYVKNSAYTNSFFHRSVPGFVVQGGGFYINSSGAAEAITTYSDFQAI